MLKSQSSAEDRIDTLKNLLELNTNSITKIQNFTYFTDDFLKENALEM